jgi:hypothetical protein
MNPLHKHAQRLDGAFTAISNRLDACKTPAQVHAYLDELEAEIIEQPYGDALHEHACELAHIRINTLFYNSLKEAAQ